MERGTDLERREREERDGERGTDLERRERDGERDRYREERERDGERDRYREEREMERGITPSGQHRVKRPQEDSRRDLRAATGARAAQYSALPVNVTPSSTPHLPLLASPHRHRHAANVHSVSRPFLLVH